MEVKFNDNHLIAYGEQNSGKASPYAYAYDRRKKLSQVAICITGSPEYILEKLKKMVVEMEGDAKKPVQGVMVHHTGSMCEVQTPVWEGEIFNKETPQVAAI